MILPPVIEHETIKKESVEPKFYKELEEIAKRSEILGFDSKGLVKAQHYVGIFQTKNGLTLEILPKISRQIDTLKSQEVLFKMLQALPTFPLKRVWRVGLFEKKGSILEIFISIFLDELELLVAKGLKRDYIIVKENQPYLKGKLLIHKHLQKNYIHKERFYVEYDEYLPNRFENRAIKSALLLLNRLTKTFSNKKRISQMLYIFDEIEPLKSYKKLKTHKLDRTLRYYEDVIAWVKLFLFGKSAKISAGSHITWSLLFDMNRLFEVYVGRYMKKHAQNVTLQRNIYFFDNPKSSAMHADIVVDDRFVLDTKWKVIKSQGDISIQDLRQLFVYAAKMRKVEKVALVFPKVYDVLIPKKTSTICKRNVTFCFLFFDLQKDCFVQNSCL